MGNVLSLFQLLRSVAGILILYGVFKFAEIYYNQWTSPIRDLPGPKSPSWLWGNIWEISSDPPTIQEKWVEQYGLTIKYKGFFGMTRLFTTDPKAIGHILMNSQEYQKPEHLRYVWDQIVGSGLLVVEGEKRKQQRRVMNPAFGAAQIRELTEIFIDKSAELRDAWTREIAKQGEYGEVEVLGWLGDATLNIIGVAGFNHHFDNLGETPKPDDFYEAFLLVLEANKGLVLGFLRSMFPLFRLLPNTRRAEVRKAQATMARVGNQLLREIKARGVDPEQAAKKRRDVLSLLVQANMSKEIPESQRMSDEDVLAQLPTFIIAGHETTSIATTWALYALCRDQEIQKKLREELISVPTENPTMDDLNALPYLDSVIRETLRLFPPQVSALRIATRDDVLPLSKPFTDRRGRVQEGLSIRKGQILTIPILNLNRAKWIWGKDAVEFRPGRWASVPEAALAIPGTWGNMMSFLGGPRACVGYRFALVVMKALLFTLIRSFEFKLAVPVEDVAKDEMIMQRPVLKSDPKRGSQMPLLVKPVSQS
ncbi:cytochrome P450 [Pluteus cervinus]|uniref:Cytochrome P450 n=1 Tax=Pluteus cervinus TaxID=181527 RepID=A0ACD3A723_9AGAR|nr:cytochrome P450 [Pluteus cervinus]